MLHYKIKIPVVIQANTKRRRNVVLMLGSVADSDTTFSQVEQRDKSMCLLSQFKMAAKQPINKISINLW